MLIQIQNIGEEGLSVHFEESAEKFPVLCDMVNAGECKFVKPVITEAYVFQMGELINLEGTVETEARLFCSRCLKAYNTPMTDRFKLTFVRELPETLKESSSSEIELDAKEMGLILFKGDSIDLREAIQEQVVLAYPQRPLCRNSCKGLCSRCGGDLNERDCGCERTALDSRFEILKDLKIKE